MDQLPAAQSQSSNVADSLSEAQLPEEQLLGQFIPLHYHYNMLQDEHRVTAFKAAIKHVVRPGMKVLELGGGTGILSSFAARAGAEVFCVERNPQLVEACRNLVQHNGLSDRIHVIQADACDYLPPGPVDAVICEMLHVALLRERQLAVIDSFKQRYQDRFCCELPRFLPEASVLTFQLVQQSFNFAGYDAPLPLFQAPIAEHPRTTELSELTTYAQFCYDEPFPQSFDWNAQIEIVRPGVVSAARFITQNLITIMTETGTCVSWPNQFLVLPVSKPLTVFPGDSIAVRFAYQGGQSLHHLADSLTVLPITHKLPLRRVA